jgi:hypothetical protein
MHIQDKNKFNKIYIENQNIQITEANTCYCPWQSIESSIGTTVLTCCSGYNVPTLFQCFAKDSNKYLPRLSVYSGFLYRFCWTCSCPEYA